jgi:4-hydroxy-3-methylbut-2-enyl diphosphate reductase
VAACQPAPDEQLAVVTQTTLSVDDAADIAAAVVARVPARCAKPKHARHLLRHPEPPGRGQAARARRRTWSSWWAAARAATATACAKLAERLGTPSVHGRQRRWTCSPTGSKAGARVGLTAGASAPDILVQQVIARLHGARRRLRAQDGWRAGDRALPAAHGPGLTHSHGRGHGVARQRAELPIQPSHGQFHARHQPAAAQTSTASSRAC